MDHSNDLFLNDSWSLYFHDPYNNNWDIDSYIPLTTISSVSDWLNVHNDINKNWSKGMFFIMREHIMPIWEDEHNHNGGSISIKFDKDELIDNWFEIISKTIGETLLKNREDWESVCGISVSPKRNFCIARIWVNDSTFGNINLYDINIPKYSKVLYKPHIENV